MSVLRAAWLVARKDLQLELRTKEILTSTGLFAVLASGGWLLQEGAGPSASEALLETVVHRVADNFVEEVSAQELYDKAIDGLLFELSDPYAAFIRAEDQTTALLSNSYGGVGVRILAEDTLDYAQDLAITTKDTIERDLKNSVQTYRALKYGD